MFVSFFYLLRQRGLDVAPNEWMTLLEGMEKGLHNASLTGFYHLCRAIVIKNETEFDRFDQVFLEFFKDVPFKGEMPEEFMEWLNNPKEDLKRSLEELQAKSGPLMDETMEDLLKRASKQNFIPVVDDKNTFIGIVTRRSIIKYCQTELLPRKAAT